MSLDSFSVKQLLELDACTRCGQCQLWCETYADRPQDLLAPVERLQEFKRVLKAEHLPSWLARLLGARRADAEGLQKLSQAAFDCTLCGRCAAVCPVNLDLVGLWLSCRANMVERGLYPPGMNLARDAVASQHNVLAYPNQERALWVEYMLEAPEDLYQRERAEVVYYVGCMSSFSPAAQGIPEAFVQVLDRAGVSFTILGESEWCCGFPLSAAGMRAEATATREHNAELVRQKGAHTVVFTCPSCYHFWDTEYRELLPGVEMVHSTQLLARLLTEGKLRPERREIAVTYHDPCDLGRNSGIYEAPRRLLEQMPGLRFSEAHLNRDRAHCCGGGGDLEIADANLAYSIAQRTLQSLLANGAETVITACPQCKRMLRGAVEKTGGQTPVVDVAELLLSVL